MNQKIFLMANAFDHEPNIVQRGCLISSSAYLISRSFFGLDQETSYNERERERERERESSLWWTKQRGCVKVMRI